MEPTVSLAPVEEPITPDQGRVSIEGPLVITFVLGAVAYMFIDLHYRTSYKMIDWLNERFNLPFLRFEK